eukprot:CAMPEP_0194513270 /NCGR_PEP_ID=MMETSP0253-20130528/45490_1 /TAXON_ID=2966 /ORGANISM="Noctiluca scintillans" /LENGTH=335 /DNA_ID=CAMNT_0039356811 /DNA_START=147 /DNA_END=1154 /DNA_ORIENTATION=+
MVAYDSVLVLLLMAHVRCMLTNPGTVSEHLDPYLVKVMRWEFRQKKRTEPWALSTGSRKWWCTECDVFRPRHTHHCKTCKTCILELDHHCYWVNNCVGWRNHKYFFLFVIYGLIGCCWSAVLLAYGLSGRKTADACLDGLAANAGLTPHAEEPLPRLLRWWSVGMCGVSSFFSLFALTMFFDQWEFMALGYGVIDKKQKKCSEPDKQMKRVESDISPLTSEVSRQTPKTSSCLTSRSLAKLPRIMGEEVGLRWLLPVAPGSFDEADVPDDDLVISAQRKYRQEVAALCLGSRGRRRTEPDDHREAHPSQPSRASTRSASEGSSTVGLARSARSAS